VVRLFVLAGEQQSAEVHALAQCDQTAALGNAGATVYYTEPVEANPAITRNPCTNSLRNIHKGKVDLLLVLGGNPVTTRARLGFFRLRAELKKVHTVVHISVRTTTKRANFALRTFRKRISFETGAMRAPLTTYSVIQPLIAPLYQAHSAFELLARSRTSPA